MAKDPVCVLKEFCDSRGITTPEYEILRDPDSPDHACRFFAVVTVEHDTITGSYAHTKKEAKKNAARKALEDFSDEVAHKLPLLDAARDPVSELNEMAHGPECYTIAYTDYEMKGPPHLPSFEISAVVNGFCCPSGFALTKKEAKKQAAKNAIRTIDSGTLYHQPKYDRHIRKKCKFGQGKDAVSCLEEYCVPRKMAYELLEYSMGSEWGCRVKIDEKKYPLHKASTKDEAKKKAAKSTLQMILDQKKENLKEANFKTKSKLKRIASTLGVADQIEKLVWEVYGICHETLTEYFTSQKVVAAFVMKQSSKDIGKVVSIGTGNRTILSDHVKKDGTRIIDSHAEIVARRGLKRYLYKQLKVYKDDISHEASIFTSKGQLLHLKPNISFHLYISRPPCGDASIFLDIGTEGIRQRHSKKQGLLRTKVEKGEGTIPTSNIDFSRINIHSCSDKICRWNVVGLQGALLSHIISPVYLHSVVIGSFKNEQASHFKRAVYGRLEKAALSLPADYRLNKCEIYTTSLSSNNEDVYSGKSSQYSINWCDGDDYVEIVNGTLGSLVGSFIQDDTSRLCKRKLYEDFLATCGIFRKITDKTKMYSSYKRNATAYCTAKEELHEAFQKSGCHSWIYFNEDVDNFCLCKPKQVLSQLLKNLTEEKRILQKYKALR